MPARNHRLWSGLDDVGCWFNHCAMQWPDITKVTSPEPSPVPERERQKRGRHIPRRVLALEPRPCRHHQLPAPNHWSSRRNWASEPWLHMEFQVFCCIAEVLLHPAIPNKARAARDTRPVMTPLMQMQDHAETKNEYGRRHKIMTNIIWWWECAKIWYTPTPPVYHLFPNETCRPHFQTRPYVNSGLL